MLVETHLAWRRTSLSNAMRRFIEASEVVCQSLHAGLSGSAGLSPAKGNEEMENWANRKTLILSRSEMIGLLTPHEYNDCVEQAYRMHGEGRYYMDPKGHIVLDRFPGEWEAMPSYIEEPHAAACKWVSIREQNREKFNLPTVFSILIYTHPETGFPLAIVDGSYHTVMRTGAAAAVSAKWMARQGFAQAGAWSAPATWPKVRSPPATRCFPGRRSVSGAAARRRSTNSSASSSRNTRASRSSRRRNLEQTVRGADVVVTLTPARGAIVMADWIAPGTHVAAVGADKKGDQELESILLTRARIFVDDIRQCRTDGEINVPLSEGVISEADIAGEIGEVVTGKKQGRTSDEEITLFNSTGIALQDSATVPLEYERALAAGVGIEKKMIST